MLPPENGFAQEGPCQICAKSQARWRSTGVRVGPRERNTGEPNSTDDVEHAAGAQRWHTA